MEQSRKKSSILPLHLGVVATEKETFGLPLTLVCPLIYLNGISPHGIVANLLSNFELQSCYFGLVPLEKAWTPLSYQLSVK